MDQLVRSLRCCDAFSQVPSYGFCVLKISRDHFGQLRCLKLWYKLNSKLFVRARVFL